MSILTPSGRLSLLSEMQPANALLPIILTLEGSAISESETHPSKAEWSMDSRPSGNLTVLSFLNPLNPPILFSVPRHLGLTMGLTLTLTRLTLSLKYSPKSRRYSLESTWNICSCAASRLAGMSNSSRPVIPAKASRLHPHPSFNRNDFNESHPRNARSSIVWTPLGIFSVCP